MRWQDGLQGYADLHPWTDLGDLPLAEELARIHDERWTPLSHSSLQLARRDAEARWAQRNLLPSPPGMKNNALVTSPAVLTSDFLHALKIQHFDTLKIKLGRDLKSEMAQLKVLEHTSWKLRFDFNGMLDESSYADFMAALSPAVREQIEYVEDPCAYDPAVWKRLHKWAPLALDQHLNLALTHGKPACDVLILKPAKNAVAETMQFAQTHGCGVTVTSYMDHAVGVVHALSIAEDLKKEYGDLILQSGCLTHRRFHKDEFTRQLSWEGPCVLPVPGVGVGFDTLLEGLPWQPLTGR